MFLVITVSYHPQYVRSARCNRLCFHKRCHSSRSSEPDRHVFLVHARTKEKRVFQMSSAAVGVRKPALQGVPTTYYLDKT